MTYPRPQQNGRPKIRHRAAPEVPVPRLLVQSSQRLSTVKPTDRLPYSHPSPFLSAYAGESHKKASYHLDQYTPMGYIEFVVSEVVCLG